MEFFSLLEQIIHLKTYAIIILLPFYEKQLPGRIQALTIKPMLANIYL